jgi:hypothetical protein
LADETPLYGVYQPEHHLPRPSSTDDDMNHHLLELSNGATVEMDFGETAGRIDCTWSEPPRPEWRPMLEREYEPWRNRILAEWCRRT